MGIYEPPRNGGPGMFGTGGWNCCQIWRSMEVDRVCNGVLWRVAPKLPPTHIYMELGGANGKSSLLWKQPKSRKDPLAALS